MFSPVVWLGIVVAGVAAALWVLSGVMRARGIGVREQDPSVRSARKKEVSAGQATGKKAAGKKQATRNDDDIEDLDDIEAILKRHGI